MVVGLVYVFNSCAATIPQQWILVSNKWTSRQWRMQYRKDKIWATSRDATCQKTPRSCFWQHVQRLSQRIYINTFAYRKGIPHFCQKNSLTFPAGMTLTNRDSSKLQPGLVSTGTPKHGTR